MYCFHDYLISSGGDLKNSGVKSPKDVKFVDDTAMVDNSRENSTG